MLHPNPPRLVTVVIALALIAVGLSATVFPLDFVNQALDLVQSTIGTDIEVTTEIAWLFLFAGDALLIAGSLPARDLTRWVRRMNFAPRMPTIIVALALVLIGLLGTFVGTLPAIAGMSSETIGAWSFVVGAIVLVAGMIFEGI